MDLRCQKTVKTDENSDKNPVLAVLAVLNEET